MAPVIIVMVTSDVTGYDKVSYHDELAFSTCAHDYVIKWKKFPRYWPFVGHRWIPCTQRPVTGSFDVFFDLRPNERLSKQS